MKPRRMGQFRGMTDDAAPALSADPAAMTARAREVIQLNIAALQALVANPDYSCASLVSRLLIRPENGEYLFVHALIRDAVYGSLLKALVDGDPALLDRLAALLGPGGRLAIRVNRSSRRLSRKSRRTSSTSSRTRNSTTATRSCAASPSRTG